MQLQQIKKKYPHEWVLIEYEELDDNYEIKTGHVIAHSQNKEEIYKALTKTQGKNIALEYTGPTDEDLTVMFLLA